MDIYRTESIMERNSKPCSGSMTGADACREGKELLVRLLNQTGVPRNTAGYSYLFLLALRLAEMNAVKVHLFTELYPQIAAELDSSVSKIERSIRYAIEAAWNRNREGLKRSLGYHHDVRPYASEFIWHLTDQYRILLRSVQHFPLHCDHTVS